MQAGNTVESLRPVNVNDVPPVNGFPTIEVEAPEVETVPETESEHVSREEHNDLRDAFLRLVARIDKFNIGAPHKI